MDNVDVFYSLWAGAMVFGMQCGFAMLCAGSLRQKNAKNIMLQNILDACGGAIGFFLCGYAFAFGSGNGNSFIGSTRDFFCIHGLMDGTDLIDFFFQFAFAASCATIVAGTIAERCQMTAYFCYAFALTAFIYPIVVHAVWNSEGFLSTGNDKPFLGVGMIDFAGSGVVHMTGGMCALLGAIVLGPRIGRFHDENGNLLDEPADFRPHSVALQCLGTFILWFGWYGFNAGSTLGISGENDGSIAALAAVNTTMSGAGAGVASMILDSILGYIRDGEVHYDLTMAMNGSLAGLVGVTGACAVVEPWAGLLIGMISGCIYCLGSSLLIKLKIDDSVDGVPVHLFAGIWGCIATGLFAEPMRTKIAYGEQMEHFGWFYSWGRGSGDAHLLLAEICGILFIVAWTCCTMLPFFFVLNSLGLFRINPLEEQVGMDISRHRGPAYMLEDTDKEAIDLLNQSRSQHKYSLTSSRNDGNPAKDELDLSGKNPQDDVNAANSAA
jgi:Amt family ammonium transporter